MDLFKQKLNKYISFKSLSKDKKAQATTEYILFIIILFAASYGMIKLFIFIWKCKFVLLGYGKEALNVFI